MRLTLCEATTHKTRPDHNNSTTPGPELGALIFARSAWFLYITSPANQYREDAGDGAYGLPSLSEKTRTSKHLQMSLQRLHILLSYFKTLSVGPVWGSNHRPPVRQSGALPIELTRRRLLTSLIYMSAKTFFQFTKSCLR